MAIKSVYHKTEEMGVFDGSKFYTDKKVLNNSDEVFVISSNGMGDQLVPYLEGHFVVDSVRGGEYPVKGRKFNFESILRPIARPKEPIDISSIRDSLGYRKFASRFMNQVKPNLSTSEIKEFESKLSQDHEKGLSNQGSDDNLSQDLQEIMQSDTEQTQNILARIGQGKFRKNVVSVWGLEREICVLTGIVLPAILTASHIIPWSECVEENAGKRWDGANGVLLCAHIDRLFDRYHLSFLRKGSSCVIQYSESLSVDYMRQLGLTRDLELVPNRMNSSDRDRFFGYMEVHYKRFLEIEVERNSKFLSRTRA